jgi:hypothetical protein
VRAGVPAVHVSAGARGGGGADCGRGQRQQRGAPYPPEHGPGEDTAPALFPASAGAAVTGPGVPPWRYRNRRRVHLCMRTASLGLGTWRFPSAPPGRGGRLSVGQCPLVPRRCPISQLSPGPPLPSLACQPAPLSPVWCAAHSHIIFCRVAQVVGALRHLDKGDAQSLLGRARFGLLR